MKIGEEEEENSVNACVNTIIIVDDGHTCSRLVC